MTRPLSKFLSHFFKTISVHEPGLYFKSHNVVENYISGAVKPSYVTERI